MSPFFSVAWETLGNPQRAPTQQVIDEIFCGAGGVTGRDEIEVAGNRKRARLNIFQCRLNDAVAFTQADADDVVIQPGERQHADGGVALRNLGLLFIVRSGDQPGRRCAGLLVPEYIMHEHMPGAPVPLFVDHDDFSVGSAESLPVGYFAEIDVANLLPGKNAHTAVINFRGQRAGHGIAADLLHF